MHVLHAFAALGIIASAATLTAQSTVVSPVTAATVEGNSGNAAPFATAVGRRYQQAHDDIGGSPKLIRKLAFRINASTANFTGTAALNMELLFGNTRPIEQMSYTFAQNWVGAPTTVIARKSINFGPQGKAVLPGPSPFTGNMDLILDAPFPYMGANPLLWEAVVYSNTLTGSFSGMDAEATNFTSGRSTLTGTGCYATGRSGTMGHTATFVDVQGTLLANFTVIGGPSHSPAVLSLGRTNPNTAVPGLCSNLLTDAVFTVSLGSTDANGLIEWSTPTGRTFSATPNTLAGAVITTQVHCIDPGRPDAIGVCNSDGWSVVAPMSNLTKRVGVFRVYNVSGTTATEGFFFGNTSNLGYGLVTEFTY